MNDFIMTGRCPRCAGEILPTSDKPFDIIRTSEKPFDRNTVLDEGNAGFFRTRDPIDEIPPDLLKNLAEDFARIFGMSRAEWIKAAERLLESKPKQVRRVDFFDFMRWWTDSNARGPTGGWMAKPLESYQYTASKLSRDARLARDEAERLFHVEVDLKASAKGPMMRCKLCNGDWLVGEWE